MLQTTRTPGKGDSSVPGPPTSDQTGSEAVPKEIKFYIGALACSIPVSAVNNLGFRRMHFQVAPRQPRLKLGLKGFSFVLGPAVYQPVISISTPREFRVCPHHPEIKRVVHKKIG